MRRMGMAVAVAVLAAAGGQSASAQSAADMSFFVTSVNPGKGGDLGGLAGADAHCASLAGAAGAGGKTWRAYLSADAMGGQAAVNARDRIGNGPWKNAKGVIVAVDLAELHGPNNAISKQNGLDEKGNTVNGRGDSPNRHDILTGSNAEGMLVAGMTCQAWTSSSSDHKGFVGHHDRIGLRDDAPSKSWNASHPSRGCGADDLPKSGGAGLFYCFAAN
jgi:hypothetical protein